MTNTALSHQIRNIRNLLAEINERDDAAVFESYRTQLNQVKDAGFLSAEAAESWVQCLTDRINFLNKPKKNPITEDGFYQMGEVIYKVQVAVHGSGKLYAKRLEFFDPETGEDYTAWDRKTQQYVARGKFNYAPGAVAQLAPENKMTEAQALAWGQLYGKCCRCGKALTLEVSIARGMGSTCAGKAAGW